MDRPAAKGYLGRVKFRVQVVPNWYSGKAARVNADWIKSPTARRVLAHWADARPAWLWSQDGARLIWRNDAARFFRGKIKKHGLKLAPEAVPIRGQVARLVRLGSPGRSSLSRIQFLSGDRPVSTTCACTPLQMPGGEIALLIVAVDPIEPDLLEADPHRAPDAATLQVLPDGAEFLIVDDDSRIAGGSGHALAAYAPLIESEGIPQLPDDDVGMADLAGDKVMLARFRASPNDAILLVFWQPNKGEAGGLPAPVLDETIIDDREPPLPLGLPSTPSLPVQPLSESDNWVEPIPDEPDRRSLSSLFERLADDAGLFTPLTTADEQFVGPPPSVPEAIFVPPEESADDVSAIREDEGFVPESVVMAEAPELDAIGALIASAQAEEIEEPVLPRLWQVTGRGFIPASVEQLPPQVEKPALVTVEVPDTETVERVSRYNFDELSRILTDRVGRAPLVEKADAPSVEEKVKTETAQISVAGETFILNRLPLGILVFRDQQVLFANRALTEMVGYESIESVRAAGLGAIFAADAVAAGPVSQLVRKDGGLVAVNARLQSISWHGRPALMLSASTAEQGIGHEGAVRQFASLAADVSEDGFIAFDRSGVITEVSLQGRVLLGEPDELLVGKPIAALIEPASLGELRHFLERPARFAETARPALHVPMLDRTLALSLFALGQAGIVSGYFGFIRRKATGYLPKEFQTTKAEASLEPTVVARLSRGLRRPLNSIIGFADMIGGPDGDGIPPERQAEYARDIRSAGEEIATLIDEMDEYARLQEGRYTAQRDDVELASLLDSCVLRVKSHAGTARVLVRNAVSENLPGIVADRASLSQALLNLLASAIEQTPAGGSVILSAQQEDDGSVVVNLRDGGNTHRDMGERFMVFRDGPGRDGETLAPVRSSVGLALTRSLLAVNALSLSVDPTVGNGTLFSLVIPATKVKA